MDYLESIPDNIFLLGYIVYLLILVVAARGFFFSSKTSPESFSRLDMISIAYLKGGVTGVIQTVFFDLWNRGLIEVGSNWRATVHPEKGSMNDLEATIAGELAAYKLVGSGLRKPGPATRRKLTPFLSPIELELKNNGLLTDNAVRWRQRGVKWAVLLVGLLPGLLKGFIGLHNSNPDILLLASLPVFAVLVFIFMRTPKGASPAARKYLKELSKQYQGELDSQRAGLVTQSGPSVLAAIFGVGALAAAYAPLLPLFPPQKISRSGCSGCSNWSSYGCSLVSGCSDAESPDSSYDYDSSYGADGSDYSDSSSDSDSSDSSGGGGCGGCGNSD